ncbi:serine/threonine-protein kinase [Acidianus brierleyi]|nr:serine/threonine-protein kinase [Acidianus brierleyi]
MSNNPSISLSTVIINSILLGLFIGTFIDGGILLSNYGIPKNISQAITKTVNTLRTNFTKSYTQTVTQNSIKTQNNATNPNKLLGKYEIIELIGEGGYAKVYKARNVNDSSLVAIKVPNIADKDFVKEIAVWLNLNHPNIVKLLDYDINPRPYIVMELMNGTLEGKVLEPITATRIILDVLSGLKYAHEKGIIHRDIKPSNILLDTNGRAKISDWGIAKLGNTKTTTKDLTFTLLYASPEQLDPRLGNVDEKSDIYQTCEVLYEILTGVQAFQGSITEITFKKINEQFKLPSTINPNLKYYDHLFQKCFSVKKENRYTTTDLMKELSQKQTQDLTNSRTGAYAIVELAYMYAQNDDFEEALFWINRLRNKNNVKELDDAVAILEEKIKNNVGTKEQIIEELEKLRKLVALGKI